MSGRRALMMANAALPYKQRVSYLQSTGTQYIDTGVFPTSNMEIEVGIKGAKFGTSTNIFIYGARYGADNPGNYALVNYMATSKLRFDRGAISYSPRGDIVPETYTVVKRVGVENFINGQSVSPCIATFINVPFTLYLFATNQSDAVFHGADDSFSLYFCKIKNDAGALVRDFIPVLDNSDVACLYDKVSGQLFHNQGTGYFLYA